MVLWSTWLASKIATFTQHSIGKMSIFCQYYCLRSFKNSVLTVVLVVGVVVDVVGVVVDVVGV